MASSVLGAMRVAAAGIAVVANRQKHPKSPVGQRPSGPSTPWWPETTRGIATAPNTKPEHTDASQSLDSPPPSPNNFNLSEVIPAGLQRPVAALPPALLATTALYPINVAITYKQANNTHFWAACQQMTNHGTNKSNAFKGLPHILSRAALQRGTQYWMLETTRSHLGETSLPTLVINLFASASASLADTLIMAPAEVKSMAAQMSTISGKSPEAAFKSFCLKRGYLAIGIRDLIANSAGFTAPQLLREAWDIEESSVPNKMGTTFVSQVVANIILTPIDAIKTGVLTNATMSAKDVVTSLWTENRLWNGYVLRTGRQATMFTLVFVGAEYAHDCMFPKAEHQKQPEA